MRKSQRVGPGGQGQQRGAVVGGRTWGVEGEHGRPRGSEAQHTFYRLALKV